MNNFELLAPAGDLEKLKIAIIYGADAVYFGGETFSLRAGAGNFTYDDMKEGIDFAHNRGKKCYLTINIFAHNDDIEPLIDYLNRIKDLEIDAFIVSDPGIIKLIKDIITNSEIHLSTQANMTNYVTAKFWYDIGVKRIVLARELTFKEIKELRQKMPKDMEIEAFVHGAMCISYSGRCLLSNFMTERDANRGKCAHPCRWQYSLVEEQRPEDMYPIEEDERGTYILNSRDLSMIDHIPELIESGVISAKIEGRMKSIFYVATIIKVYRKAIDEYFKDPDNYLFKEEWYSELRKASHREFTTGFYFNKPTNKDQDYRTSAYTREYDFVGLVKEFDEETMIATIEQRNKMSIGDEIEVFGPNIEYFTQIIEFMEDNEGNPIKSAPHAQEIVKIKLKQCVEENYMLRMKR